MRTPLILPSDKSSRRELQGPRPTPLRVHNNSHNIRKPPTAAQPQHRPPHAPPVIIYTVSPKIIHANPNEFMSLVQRLTGSNSSNSPSTCSSPFGGAGAAVSPAARFASIEKTRSQKPHIFHRNMETVEGMEIGSDALTNGQFPGILSPDPNALPPISPKFFSPPLNNNPLSFFFDLSPVLHSNSNRNNHLENSNFILPSPSSSILMISPKINLPSPNTLDLFRTLFDL